MRLLTFAAAAACAVAVPAAAAEPSPAPAPVVSLVQVSGGAANGKCPTTGGTTPQLAIDPGNPAHEVATWEVGSGVTEYQGTSRDGGATWTAQPLPGVTSCSGGSAGSIVDPYLATASNGLTIASSSWVTNDSMTPAAQGAAIRDYLSMSTDGGATVGTPTVLESSQPDQRAPVVIEPDNPSHVLISTERSNIIEPAGYVPAAGSIAVLRSTDGGKTFAAPVTLTLPSTSLVGLTGGLAYTRLGVVAIVAEVPPSSLPTIANGSPTPETILAYRSTDDGQSFGEPVTLGTFTSGVEGGSAAGCCIPDLAGTPTGDLAVVWPSPTNGQVTLVTSRDGGATWSSGVGATAPHTSLLAAVTVLADGRVGIVYDDRWTDGAAQLAQPYVHISAGDGEPEVTAVLSPAFDIASITDGDSGDTGNLGPEQDIAATADGVRALVSLAGQPGEKAGDVEVYQASVSFAAQAAGQPTVVAKHAAAKPAVTQSKKSLRRHITHPDAPVQGSTLAYTGLRGGLPWLALVGLGSGLALRSRRLDAGLTGTGDGDDATPGA